MVPTTMNVIACPVPGGPEALQWVQRPMPEPTSDEVLIKVAAAGVNRADVLQRQGNYPPPEGASPDIPGMEIAGEIVTIGDQVTRWKVGDKVCALLAGGGYAEYATAPAGQCLPVPKKFTFAEAAALPEAIITVWANLFEAGALGSAQTALVHGGSSGIGTIAISMIKAFGAKVFVTAGSEEKCAACRKLGADFCHQLQNR